MNTQTQRALQAILTSDQAVSNVQRAAAIAILNGRVPQKWPAFINRASIKYSRKSATPPHAGPAKTYYSRREAAEYMGISVRLLDQMKKRGDIPFIRLSDRRLLFSKTDLDQVLKEARIDVMEE